MFNKFDPRDGKILEIMDYNGVVNNHYGFDILSDEKIIESYKVMLLTRVADEWAISLQRQGRMPTFPPTIGQEAIPLGALMGLNKDDWFVIAYRELSGWLYRGIPLKNWYGYYYGDEKYSHLEVDKYHTLPPSVPIASQLLHAAGLGYAEKYKESKRVSIGFVGDGGTSEGDFHEALNFASVWSAGTIFIVQNNQYAISCPREKQTKSKTIAEKGFSYGIPGIQVDGNDILAVNLAVKEAAKRARSGLGPTLIEAVTYRLGPHTTADDPTLYRSNEEVELWKPKDPILRVEKYLLNKKLITLDQIEELKKGYKNYSKEQFEYVENGKDPDIEDIYKYTYNSLPKILKRQLDEKKRLRGG